MVTVKLDPIRYAVIQWSYYEKKGEAVVSQGRKPKTTGRRCISCSVTFHTKDKTASGFDWVKAVVSPYPGDNFSAMQGRRLSLTKALQDASERNIITRHHRRMIWKGLAAQGVHVGPPTKPNGVTTAAEQERAAKVASNYGDDVEFFTVGDSKAVFVKILDVHGGFIMAMPLVRCGDTWRPSCCAQFIHAGELRPWKGDKIKMADSSYWGSRGDY